MKCGNRILIALLVVFTFPSAKAFDLVNAVGYACVRGNTQYYNAYAGKDSTFMFFTAGNGQYFPFPKTPKDIVESSDLDFGSIRFSECSNDSFFCAKAQQKYMGVEPVWSYFLVLPRVLRANSESDFMGVHIKVRSAPVHGEQRNLRMHVTLSQLVNGAQAPIVLVVELGRGIIYWDGFKLTQEDTGVGQTCILGTEYGLFYEAEIKAS